MLWSIVFSSGECSSCHLDLTNLELTGLRAFSAIIMEGYDTLLLGQFYAQPAFARVSTALGSQVEEVTQTDAPPSDYLQRFGELNPVKGIYEIPTKWQTSLGVSTQIGNILGLQITGWASERFGYRITMLVALICLTGFLFIQFFAANLGMLLAGYLLLGVSLFAGHIDSQISS